MGYTIYIIGIFASFLGLLVGCGGGVSSGGRHVVYDTLYSPVHAGHFVVLGRGDSVVLRVLNPWQGATGVQKDYLFMEGDTAQRLVTMSTSHSAFLEALGVGDRVVGVSSPVYLSSVRMQQLPDVGYDASPNYETIVSLRPSHVLCYEVAGGNAAYISKLESLGIPTLYVADYLEPTPLAKAEWVVAFGALSGTLDSAVRLFKSVEQSYLHTRDSIASYLTQSGRCPVVMLNSPYKDVWYLPGDLSFVVQMIEDAGGVYAASGVADNVSRAVSMESAYDFLRRSDLWLHPAAHIKHRADIVGEVPLLRGVDIPVWNNNKRQGPGGGSDIWESGTLRCDLVLRDLAAIFHPEFSTDSLYYYMELE